MPFTTAQQHRMDSILMEEPDIAVNRLKNIIGSTNWTAVKNYIGIFKSEATTEVMPEARHDIIDAFPYGLEEPEDTILVALDTLIFTANLAVTEARELLERRNVFLAMQLESRKQWLEGYITVK